MDLKIFCVLLSCFSIPYQMKPLNFINSVKDWVLKNKIQNILPYVIFVWVLLFMVPGDIL